MKPRVHVPKPIPERSWKPQYGWGLSLVRIDDGSRVVRTRGMRTRDEAITERDEALRTGRYESAWIWEMIEPSRIVPFRRR